MFENINGLVNRISWLQILTLIYIWYECLNNLEFRNQNMVSITITNSLQWFLIFFSTDSYQSQRSKYHPYCNYNVYLGHLVAACRDCYLFSVLSDNLCTNWDIRDVESIVWVEKILELWCLSVICVYWKYSRTQRVFPFLSSVHGWLTSVPEPLFTGIPILTEKFFPGIRSPGLPAIQQLVCLQ